MVLNPNMTLKDFSEHFGINLEKLEDWVVSQFDEEDEDKEIIEMSDEPEIVNTFGLSLIPGGKAASLSEKLIKKYKF